MKVNISRHWHKPAIETFVTDTSITLECELEDFVKGMMEEMGPAWKLMTQKRLEAKMLEAMASAQKKIQQVSSQAIL